MKTTMKYHLTQVKVAIIKKSKLSTINAGEVVEKNEPFYTLDRNVNWFSHYGEKYGHSFKNQKQNYHMIQQSYFSGTYPEKMKIIHSEEYKHHSVNSSTIYNSQDMEAT